MSTIPPDIASAIIERLDRIEAALATLAAGPARHREGTRLRMTTAEACQALRCSETTLRGLASRGLCSQVRPKGKGPGKPVYYLPDEIAALAVSEQSALELMSRKKSRARVTR